MAGRHLRKQKKESRVQEVLSGKLPDNSAKPLGGLPPEGIPSQPIPAQDVMAMAASGKNVNRGNSNKAPLTEGGHAQAQEAGADLAAAGGLDELKSSSADRAMQTSQDIAAADPKHPQPQPVDGLQSWAQGNMEGMPEKDAKKQIADLVRKNPAYRIPGQGALSSKPGESFDDFRLRALPMVRAAMQELAHDPSKVMGITLHSQVIKLIKSWVAKGCPDDFSVDPNTFLKSESEDPGKVERLYPIPKPPHWKIDDGDFLKTGLIPGSIYLIRHGMTALNKENYESKGKGSDALMTMVKHIKAGDFGRVQAFAKMASQQGVSDDEISQAIDSALPSPQEASGLANHHLLAAASIASPAKRKEYHPVIQERFAPVDGLEPAARHALSTHLQSIGMRGNQ